ncbi:receptor-like serine/threonine-protein kinase SD1-8 isoform X2 [Elaeis guineensis]|uniref:Receptor-like serine/threonine-protein kinase n=1 Tax=Elaeis guineensis var. tenera TaxID=51953 RepID=A0A6I9R3C4_ELAGV|nr:receptor-like serine/threonine-protein kinase SD1-8 isoform X2 [Elaeis guineensis]
MAIAEFLLLLTISAAVFPLHVQPGDTITPSKAIMDGQTLISSKGTFEMGFFNPHDSKNQYLGIWYRNIPVQTVVWVANRDSPLNSSTGVLNLTSNGNLVLLNDSGYVLWSTGTSNVTNPTVQLLDSGNLILTGGTSKSLLWQSFDHPCDTLLPGMKLGWDSSTNFNRYLTSWRSASDPSPGEYAYKFNIHGVPEVFLWEKSARIYRSGPWNGQGYSGRPEMIKNNMFRFHFISNQDEHYYTYEVLDSSIISRLVLSDGKAQRFLWSKVKNDWNSYWYVPKDPCDKYAYCGANGVCNTSYSLFCQCLKGFDPKSTNDWNQRVYLGGCVRKTRLDFQSDRFSELVNVKLPDALNATADSNRSLDECREWCLKNFSCVAFAFSGGSGCLTWTGDLVDIKVFAEGGENLFVRLAASDLDTTKGDSSKKQRAIVIIIPLILGFLVFVFLGLFMLKKKRKQGIIGDSCSKESSGKELELPLFDMSVMESATDNFYSNNKLGEGGFGPVYKGQLRDGQEIAVKRLSKDSVQGLDEFKNEVMLIAKLQHRNLVRLLGCCIQREERMLIYEYMPNKSLDTFIFGIARGLLYLHQDSRLKIIHRDLKASNILLDKDMNPKISDFGTARIFKGDQNQENTRRVVGTYGYMSPEYAMDGIFSVKSDVFSFGVIILEILSGKKNRMLKQVEPHVNLLGYAWRLWEEDRCLELLDKAVKCSYPISKVLRCIQIGLLCVQEGSEDRPTMTEVVLMLSNEGVALTQPKRPGFCIGRTPIERDCSSTEQHSSTVNEITDTLLEGR